MNILDENAPADQRSQLSTWGISIHQIGVDVGRKGMKDEEIIPFLHALHDTTFFTRDLGFGQRKLCHPRYCLVCLDIDKDDVAVFVRRVLNHPELDTKAKRILEWIPQVPPLLGLECGSSISSSQDNPA